MTPFVRSMLYACRRCSRVETSASGEFAPSFSRKIGSFPLVASKRLATLTALTLIFSAGWWQVTHRRPFVPRSRKNGLSGATTGKPATLMVLASPDSFVALKARPLSSSPRASGMTAVTVTTAMATLIRRCVMAPPPWRD